MRKKIKKRKLKKKRKIKTYKKRINFRPNLFKQKKTKFSLFKEYRNQVKKIKKNIKKGK